MKSISFLSRRISAGNAVAVIDWIVLAAAVVGLAIATWIATDRHLNAPVAMHGQTR